MDKEEFDEKPPEEIEFKDRIDEGLNDVFRVKYGSRDAVLKIHTEKRDEDFYHDYEAIALKRISQRTEIPVPEVFNFSRKGQTSYLIMEDVRGISGNEILEETSFHQKKGLIKDFGRYLDQLHSSLGFGSFGHLRREQKDIEVWRRFGSWKELLLHHMEMDIRALKGSRFESFIDKIRRSKEERREVLERDFEPVLIHDDNRYSNLIYDGGIRTVLDWATGYNGEPRYDVVKAEFLLIDYKLTGLSSDKREELRSALYDGYGSDMRGTELRELYLLASIVWAMKGYQNWSNRLNEKERKRISQRLTEEIQLIID